MNYTKNDFKACLFNPLTEGAMLTSYPSLKEILPDPQADIDKLIRYVIMVYDSKSPIRRAEKDPIRLKNIAADLVMLDKSEEYRLSIFSGSDTTTFLLVTRYLVRFVKEKEFAALCAFEFKYYENINELLTPIIGLTNAERLDAARKKSVISDEVDKDIKRIDEYWEMIYGDKDLVKEVKVKRMTPEMVAITI